MDRPCIDPLDPECPKTAPNYLNICPVVKQFLAYNRERNDVYNLTRAKLINKRSPGDFNISTTYSNVTYRNITYSNNKSVAIDRIANDEKSKKESLARKKKSDEDECKFYESAVRKILRADRLLAEKFLPKNSTANFAKELTNGCTGFAENYMQWPEDLIIGGVQRDRGEIVRAEALQSVFMVASARDVFGRVRFSEKRSLNQSSWSLEAAENVLTAWQRNFTSYVYDNINNTDDDGVRQLHPLAGTSVNDMMQEFSQFNPTVIIVGYVFMVSFRTFFL